MARPALAASRAIEIINYLAARPSEAFTLSDLVDRLGINVASMHAILRALTDAGYLTRHPRHRTYTLGPTLVAAGTAALEQHPAIALAGDEAQHLSATLDVDVLITAPVGDEAVYVARSGPHRPRGFSTHVGRRMTLRPPFGSIFLAWSDETDIEAWLSKAIGKPNDDMLQSYRQTLADVRSRGYFVGLEAPSRIGAAEPATGDAHAQFDAEAARVEAVVEAIARTPSYQVHDIDTDARYDVMLITAPVFDERGAVALAINLVGLPASMTGTDVRRYGEAVRDAGLVVSKRTHGRVPD
jgi:DNA-binding IclR family transcriptional regulator